MIFKKSNQKAKDENEREDLEEDFADREGEIVALKVANVGEVSLKTVYFQYKTTRPNRM